MESAVLYKLDTKAVVDMDIAWQAIHRKRGITFLKNASPTKQNFLSELIVTILRPMRRYFATLSGSVPTNAILDTYSTTMMLTQE